MIPFEQLEEVETQIRAFELRLSQSVDEFGASELLSIISNLSKLGEDGQKPAEAMLRSLKNSRAHAHLCFAATELKRRNLAPNLAARMRIQALIELGQLETAIAEISDARMALETGEEDLLELAGLEGRICKQRFVETKRNGAPDIDHLAAARRAYAEGWKRSGQTGYWHACNLLALSEIEAVTFDLQKDEEVNDALANQVIRLATSRFREDPNDPWPLASLGEASLALGQYNEALKAFGRFGQKCDNAFALNSARRQLVELWEIEARPEIELKAVYDVITADLLKKPGARLEFSPQELSGMRQRFDSDGYEGLFGGRPVPIGWVQRLIQMSECVGRVERRGSGDLTSRFGTGTVFRAKELNPDWAEYEHVFVTNEHVVSAYGRSDLKPAQAAVRFTQSSEREQVELGEALWGSRREDHDITVFHLPEVPEGTKSVSQTAELSALNPTADGAYDPVTVIGHPMGSDLLHLAIENLSVEDMEAARPEGQPERVWYKCPTMEGNSGSPVLSWKTLEALAVHHREIVSRGCNEGISLESIRSAIQLRPDGWNGPVRMT